MAEAALIAHILATLEEELLAITAAAKASFAAATDPDSKAENKYDTRTLEASYVARGQAQRVAELQEALLRFKNLPPVTEPREVALGVLVTLHAPGEEMHFLIGPAAGGTQVQYAGRNIDVITPASPLGHKLMGKAVQSSIELSPRLSARITALE